MVPSAVALCIIKFLTSKNVKPAQILTKLKAQFTEETFSRIQGYDYTKSFKEGQTEVENMQ